MSWVLLAYRMPREPSTPRIALWRRLRRLGTVQIVDGLVALPLDAKNREQLEWAAESVADSGGEASVWLADLESDAQGRALAERMRAAISREYRAIQKAARSALRESPGNRQRALVRLRRELRRVKSRDYFPPPEAEEARQAVETLASNLKVAVR